MTTMPRRPAPRTLALRDAILACLRNSSEPLPTRDIVAGVKAGTVTYLDVYNNLGALERTGAVQRAARPGSYWPPSGREVFWRLIGAQRDASHDAAFEALAAQIGNGGVDV